MNPIIIKQKVLVILLGFLFCIGLLEIGIRMGTFGILLVREYKNRISLNRTGVYRILCLGESTTAQGGKYSYPSQLEEILNKNNLNVRFKVINKGIENIDTTGILSHLQDNLEKYKPDMVITMMGVNDEGILYYRNILNLKLKLLKNFKSFKFLMLLWYDLIEEVKEKSINKFRKNNIKELNMQKSLISHKQEKEKNEIMNRFRIYKTDGNLVDAKRVLKEGIDQYPHYIPFYTWLGDTYVIEGKYKEAEAILKKAIDFEPEDSSIYETLGFCYSSQGRFNKAETVLKKAIELDPMNKFAYDKLIECYECTGKSEDLDKLFEQMNKIINTDDVFYGFMATHYTKQRNFEKAEKYYKEANEFRLRHYNTKTRDNYLKLKDILDQKGIQLVCVQYPVRSIEPLKRLFSFEKGIIFVDNEESFKAALRKGKYEDYFVDHFGGDFGHCTPRGNRLLAENIAKVLFEKVFNKK